MDPFNTLSTTAVTRKIPPLKEASPAKVMSCALVALIDLEEDLDAANEVSGGAGMPSAKMASRPANYLGRLAMVCGHSTPPQMRAGNHQRAKVPLVPEAV
jgi:hypothetical protein